MAMEIELLAVFVGYILIAPPSVFGQAGANPPEQAPIDNCWEAGAVELSAAQTKARLRHMTPLSSPMLPHLMRITNAVLSVILRVSATKHGLKTKLLNAPPQKVR